MVSFPASIAVSAAGWAVLWFLLGYLAYALLFAALGALVSRQEDVGGVTAPALMVIVLPYVLGISILPADPENQFLAIASLIPLFAPTLMPMRIAMGVAPVWQVAALGGADPRADRACWSGWPAGSTATPSCARAAGSACATPSAPPAAFLPPLLGGIVDLRTESRRSLTGCWVFPRCGRGGGLGLRMKVIAYS